MNKPELNALVARTQDMPTPFDKSAAMIYNQFIGTPMIRIGPLAHGGPGEAFDELHSLMDREPELTSLVFAAMSVLYPEFSEDYTTAFFAIDIDEDAPMYPQASAVAGQVMELMHMETIKAMVAVVSPDTELFDMHRIEPGEEIPDGYTAVRLHVTDEGMFLIPGGEPDDGTDNG